MTILHVGLAFLGGLIAGYLIGRIDNLINALRSQDTRPPSFFRPAPQTATAAASVQIDDRKYVSRIDTNSLQNVSNTALGKNTVTTDDINVSVSKLAQLKGK